MSRFSNIRRRTLDLTCGHRVVYHHVPKCGGTSIERALRRHYALSYRTFPLAPLYNALEALKPGRSLVELDDLSAQFREVQLLNLLYQDVRCIAGHVYFSEAAFREFKPKYHFITTLREPIPFFVSFYGQLANAAEPRFRIGDSLEDFLETDLAQLCGKYYALFFAPPETRNDLGSPADLRRAKDNLAKCKVVGFLDELPAFQRRLRDLLGTRLTIRHANKSKISSNVKQASLPPAIRRKIEDLSSVNIELYDFAKRELNS